MSTMEDLTKRIEEGLSHPGLPQFKSKQEIEEYARQRLAAKRNRSAGNDLQGSAVSGANTDTAIRGDQGNDRGSTEYGAGNNAARGTQAYTVHAGDGRDAYGTGGANGYTNNAPISDRVNADSGTRPNQYDRPASTTSQPAVHAPKRKGGGFRSKLSSYYKEAFAPIEKESPQKVTAAPRGRAAAPSRGGKWRPLSDAEAAAIYPKLTQYIKWQSDHLDQFIIATTKGHDPTIEIWSDLDDAEIEILADYLISRGRRDGTTAQAVRYAAEILDRIKVAVIVLPRVYRTVNLYLARGLDIQVFVR